MPESAAFGSAGWPDGYARITDIGFELLNVLPRRAALSASFRFLPESAQLDVTWLSERLSIGTCYEQLPEPLADLRFHGAT